MKFVVSPITAELIPIDEMSEHVRITLIDPKYKEQKERMFAKIWETTLAQDDEISRNIIGLARTRLDIFSTTEEEVSNAVKAEIEKKKYEQQPKEVIWDGHAGSIGCTANQALSQNISDVIGNQNNYAISNQARLGPAAPPPRPFIPSGFRPLRTPPGPALDLPRVPPNAIAYTAPTSVGLLIPPPRPPSMLMMPAVHLPPPPMPMTILLASCRSWGIGQSGQPVFTYLLLLILNSPQCQSLGHLLFLFRSPQLACYKCQLHHRHLKRHLRGFLKNQNQRDRSLTIHCSFQKISFWLSTQYPQINISIPGNIDEGNLKRRVLGIMVQSLLETVGSLKEKIAGEIQLAASKQKLRGALGFLKDNMSLAYYNVGDRENLKISLKEHSG
ncbi:hypothetical protein CDL15_Pgr020801 [Punica granatum]|uniref:Ubiquitin-like domain-containing protein n=1 Tax=Punica granatum TaxID=22663 RepID=A0A218XUX8_PUNGR|nr:hypothetical protein CDL15_Pgr020801 [Punica granatum]